MKVTILTDESKIQLPEYHKWKKTFRSGSLAIKNPALISCARANDIDIPTGDLQNEQKYQKILKEFILPAKFMFVGNFSEVRSFSEEVKRKYPCELVIFSGRYGLINENDEILPYNFFIETKDELVKYDFRLKLLKKLTESVKDTTHLIIVLPKFFISYFIEKKWFEELPQNLHIIVVTSSEFETFFSNYHNISLLRRRGVARIGKKNLDVILSQLDNSAEAR